MSGSNLRYYILSVCVAAALLAGCGGSQVPIGAPRALPQSAKVLTPDEKRAPCPTATCIYVANSAGAGSVTVYPSTATGDVKPYREITGLTNPSGIAVASRGEVDVSVPQCDVRSDATGEVQSQLQETVKVRPEVRRSICRRFCGCRRIRRIRSSRAA